MNNNATVLSVNTEVLEKMAEIAAKEVEGVSGLSKKAIDLKNADKTKQAFKGVKVENVNGAIKINVYICVEKNALVKEVAPTLFAKAGPRCVNGPCPEGAMSCGKMLEKREIFANMKVSGK